MLDLESTKRQTLVQIWSFIGSWWKMPETLTNGCYQHRLVYDEMKIKVCRWQ
jgi:hypothetical protein